MRLAARAARSDEVRGLYARRQHGSTAQAALGRGSMNRRRRKRRGASTRCVSALALALVLAWVFMVTHLLSTEPTPAPTPERPHTHAGRKNHTKKTTTAIDARSGRPRRHRAQPIS